MDTRKSCFFVLLAASFLSGCRRESPTAVSPEPKANANPAVKIGGEDVLILRRRASSGGGKPEFLSMTIFPGRGMNVFEITAGIPGKGEIPLLFSPTLEEAAKQLNGTGKDAYGDLSFSFGGAFLVPYANRIQGKLSADGKGVLAEWHGHTLTLPANWQGNRPGARKHAMHGLILEDKATDLHTETIAGGQRVTAVIRAGNFGGHWLSSTDLHFVITLMGNAVEAAITATNVGSEDEPMGIGWHPYFAIPSGDRSQVRLHAPGSMLAEVNNYDDVFPTGRLTPVIQPVRGKMYDYRSPDGVALDRHFLDDNFSHLTRSGDAVDVRLTDPKSSYGIEVQGLSPEIKTVQVYAPLDKPFVAVEEQFNYADPFGPEWRGMDTGMVTLHPGQSVSWKVRLKLLGAGS